MDAPPRYVSNTHLAARVGSLNPRWNEDSSSQRADDQFQRAMQLTGIEFLESVDYLNKVRSMSECQRTALWTFMMQQLRRFSVCMPFKQRYRSWLHTDA